MAFPWIGGPQMPGQGQGTGLNLLQQIMQMQQGRKQQWDDYKRYRGVTLPDGTTVQPPGNFAAGMPFGLNMGLGGGGMAPTPFNWNKPLESAFTAFTGRPNDPSQDLRSLFTNRIGPTTTGPGGWQTSTFGANPAPLGGLLSRFTGMFGR